MLETSWRSLISWLMSTAFFNWQHKCGHTGRFIFLYRDPVYFCPRFREGITKLAVLIYLHCWTWVLRMIVRSRGDPFGTRPGGLAGRRWTSSAGSPTTTSRWTWSAGSNTTTTSSCTTTTTSMMNLIGRFTYNNNSMYLVLKSIQVYAFVKQNNRGILYIEG